MSEATEIIPLVHADLDARAALGVERYGAPLRADAEMDGLTEAYEEALDQCVYLRLALEERNTMVERDGGVSRSQIKAWLVAATGRTLSLDSLPAAEREAFLRYWSLLCRFADALGILVREGQV